MIEKRGAWYSYKEDKIGQGHDNAVKYLEDNPAVAIDLEKILRTKLFPTQKYVSNFVTAGQPETSGTAAASGSQAQKSADSSLGKKSMLERASMAAEPQAPTGSAEPLQKQKTTAGVENEIELF